MLDREPRGNGGAVLPSREPGKLLKDNIFIDARVAARGGDELTTRDYTTRQIVERIWREHLRPHGVLLSCGVLAMLLTAATTGAIPFLIQRTADDVFVAKNADMVTWITVAIIVITTVKAISEYVANVTVGYLGHRFIADLRLQMFTKLAEADLGWIQTVHSGRILSGFLNDATLIRATASRTIVTLGENLLKVVILVGSMFYMAPRLSMLVLIFMPVAWFMLSRQRRKMRKSTTKSLQETGDLSALVTQTLQGMRGGGEGEAAEGAGSAGRRARLESHQPRARIHHAGDARSRPIEPRHGADGRLWFRRCHLCRRPKGHSR